MSAQELEETSKKIEEATFNVVDKIESMIGKKENEPKTKVEESKNYQ